MYELVVCELSAFAYSGDTSSVYLIDKHRQIVALAEEALALPMPEWNIYIEDLLRELDAKTPSVGGRRRRHSVAATTPRKLTRKRRQHHRNGQRQTVQQRVRNN